MATRRIHQERLNFEEKQIELRARADLELARGKARIERQFAMAATKAEFAQELLEDFYKVKEAFARVRNQFSFEGDGKTRKREVWESEIDSIQLDSIHVTLERLNNESEIFNRLGAKRFRFAAMFGQGAKKHIDEMFALRWEVANAARHLMQGYRARRHIPDQGAFQDFEQKIGWIADDTDPVNDRIEQALSAIENLTQGQNSLFVD